MNVSNAESPMNVDFVRIHRIITGSLEALKKRGSEIVIAEVHWKNAEVVPFYYKHGFRLSGCAQDFFGMGHDAIILKLTL